MDKLPPWPYGTPGDDSTDTTVVRLPWPSASFDSKVPGVPVITQEPTAVPLSALSALLTAARKSGVTLTLE